MLPAYAPTPQTAPKPTLAPVLDESSPKAIPRYIPDKNSVLLASRSLDKAHTVRRCTVVFVEEIVNRKC
jgi:hypothetical protein